MQLRLSTAPPEQDTARIKAAVTAYTGIALTLKPERTDPSTASQIRTYTLQLHTSFYACLIPADAISPASTVYALLATDREHVYQVSLRTVETVQGNADYTPVLYGLSGDMLIVTGYDREIRDGMDVFLTP